MIRIKIFIRKNGWLSDSVITGLCRQQGLFLKRSVEGSEKHNDTEVSFYKNDVFPAQAEYSHFAADFRLELFLYYS